MTYVLVIPLFAIPSVNNKRAREGFLIRLGMAFISSIPLSKPPERKVLPPVLIFSTEMDPRLWNELKYFNHKCKIIESCCHFTQYLPFHPCS